ncbi:uncharacterized protein [Onthophagus taurus]|uniref:uncharacterized protein isoform X2 n=1 Tax=Onthophagus taurus TaxID=166361 RepID=UPI000C1FFE74|nr:uncharacterized protein LOC111424066 isoform X2 [Onthophagus taurus]
MKFVFLIISLGVACEAFSASHRHYIKKHHHQLRDGDPISTEISSDSPTETTTPNIYSYPPISEPGSAIACPCGVICPNETTETTEAIDTIPTESSQNKRHMFHNKKIFNAPNKKHHAVRNDINKRYIPHYCPCRPCPESSTTEQPDVSTISQEPTVVNPGPSDKKHHKHH